MKKDYAKNKYNKIEIYDYIEIEVTYSGEEEVEIYDRLGLFFKPFDYTRRKEIYSTFPGKSGFTRKEKIKGNTSFTKDTICIITEELNESGIYIIFFDVEITYINKENIVAKTIIQTNKICMAIINI